MFVEEEDGTSIEQKAEYEEKMYLLTNKLAARATLRALLAASRRSL